GHPFRSEAVLDEFLNLSTALTDQGDHRYVGAGMAGDLRHQCAFPNARAGKNPHTLPQAAGVQAVDAADAGGNGFPDVGPIHRGNARGIDPAGLSRWKRAKAVHRLTETIKNAAEELL